MSSNSYPGINEAFEDPYLQSVPALRWGILGCGRISHDFTQALKLLPSASVIACATQNNHSKAQKFALKHNIPYSYGSYEELFKHPYIDIIYVGNIHLYRRPIGESILFANKHVLFEKPMACSYKDAKYLLNLAKTRKLFCLEGLWTRFFPIIQQAKKMISDDDAIGTIVQVSSSFNFNASDCEDYPESYVYNGKLGGGASLLVGPYPVAIATMFFDNKPEEKYQIVGHTDEKTGVDMQAVVLLNFPKDKNIQNSTKNFNKNLREDTATPTLSSAGMATCSFGISSEGEEITSILGTKGRLVIESPCHCPTKFTLFTKGTNRGEFTHQNFTYDLPQDTPEIIQAGGYFYPNSAGLVYEAAAVAKAVSLGWLETKEYTWENMLVTIKILDQVREKLGLVEIEDKYPIGRGWCG